jgi:hypothetical protein
MSTPAILENYLIFRTQDGVSNKKNKMSYFNFFTHPEFTQFTSGDLCPSLYKEMGEATLRWLGVSELKYDNKYILLLNWHR